MKVSDLHKIKKDTIKKLLAMYQKAKAGHIGSSLSCLDILIYLYFYKMKKNDKFILSKGHAAAALYAVLNKKGLITDKELDTYYLDGTLLSAHPPCGKDKIKGIIFGTGSLGHGLSLAVGLALAGKLKKKNHKIYCVLSDGDCNEGSTWEAAMFAAQHKLDNLVVIIDQNNLQGFGRSEEVISMEPMADKWQSFNFETEVIKNGNDFETINKGFNKMNQSKLKKPKCLIAKTTKGSGISFMEDRLEWHYLPMTDEQYNQALKEIEGNYA